MQRTVRTGKRVVRPAVCLWGRVPLRAQGKVLVALPLLAIVISAALALHGNYQRSGLEAAVERHFQTVRGLNEVLTLMVNAETGMRGYLLTEREEFLQPYATVSQDLPSAMAHLHDMAESEPGEKPRLEKSDRLDQLQVLIDQQMADLAWQQRYVASSDSSDAEVYEHLAYGKQLMDEIRANLNTMQDEEERLLSERVQEINAIRRRDYLAIFLALFIGLGTRLVAWYLFNTGVIRRVERLIENTRSLRRGKSLPFPPSSKQDHLGDLEQEIALAGEQTAECDDDR